MLRENHIKEMAKETFDVLVIGGGATGAGCALDAASRGLTVALLEQDDLASGTSSRSTKLIHGGVRYLEQAVLKFDRSQFKLVRDALHERSVLLKIAPHLTQPLALLMPLYNRMQVPYYRTGLKLYDRLAGKDSLHKSYFIPAKEALQKIPMLRPMLRKDQLRGGVIYYDGLFNDARMNVCLAVTAAEKGAKIANHVGVTALIKKAGKLIGVRATDHLTSSTFEVRAKAIINATGPFTDSIIQMDEPASPPLLSLSSGTHIVLDHRFSSKTTGLLIPKTDDNRVLFILPWLSHSVIGTTDLPSRLEKNPKPTDEDLDFILRQVNSYYSIKIDRSQIKSAWTGLRPLVSSRNEIESAKLSRDHTICRSTSGLITITGGKWTTYRKMAKDTIDFAIKSAEIKASGSSATEEIYLAGGENYRASNAKKLASDFNLEQDVSEHLNNSYGDRALIVAKMAGATKRLVKGHPYVEAEVKYAVHYEWARRIADLLARRTRLSFLDKKATLAAIPRVAKLLAKELNWAADVEQKEIEIASSVLS